MKSTLRRKMLLGFTALFLPIQIGMIITGSLLVDDFLVYSDKREFQMFLEEFNVDDYYSTQEAFQNDLKGNLGGFTLLYDEEYPTNKSDLPLPVLDGILLGVGDNLDELYFDYTENELVLASRIDETHILINIKNMDIIDDMTKLLNIFLGFISLVAFIILFSATNYYLGYFVRPIIKIKDATKRIANFDFSEKLKIRTKDELSDLAQSINFMSDELQNNMNTLIEKERLASLGEIVAGVAHEINTPLGAAVSSSSYLRDKNKEVLNLLDKGELTKEAFIEFLDIVGESTAIMDHNLTRAAKLVKNFKQISVNQISEQISEFYIEEYTNSLIHALKHEYKYKDIVFDVICDPKLKVMSYAGMYSQVLTILIMNSINHGFKDKKLGKITLKIEGRESEVEFSYRDDGRGITEENLGHIFDPFFTSNREEGGSGLGLNICYNLITGKLEGSIKCRSKLNEGTEFIIVIPRKGSIQNEYYSS